MVAMQLHIHIFVSFPNSTIRLNPSNIDSVSTLSVSYRLPLILMPFSCVIDPNEAIGNVDMKKPHFLISASPVSITW